MDPPYADRIEELFAEALGVPPAEREQFLVAACAGDLDLQRKVTVLLNAEARCAEYFDKLPERLGVANLRSRSAADELAPQAGAIGEQYGQYALTEFIGSGGMGSVWRAVRSDGRFEGEVAVKLLSRVTDSGGSERFALEGRYLAKLTHPNIARLLDAGIGPGGQPYLILEYVDGLALDKHCDAELLNIAQRIELFIQVLDAVSHAHAHLIVHRDIKPANVRVSSTGSVKLLDFGVAKLLDPQAPHSDGLTRQLGMALTPEFAAPEQLEGQAVTTATDIYSLGLLLWLLVVGTNPRDTQTARSLADLRALASREPTTLVDAATADRSPEQLRALAERRGTNPTDLLKTLRSDLDSIVRKAVAIDPSDRYASAADFAQDLRRYLRNEPVTSQVNTMRYRMRKFVQRHRGSVLAASLTGIALTSSAIMTAWQGIEAARQRDAAIYERERAQTAAQFIASIFEGVDPSLLGAERPLTALDILDQAQRRLNVELRDDPSLKMHLQTVIAQSYLGLFEPRRAHELLMKALTDARIGSPADRETVRTMHLLMAQALLELTQLDEADRYLRSVFGMLDRGMADPAYVTAKVTQSAIEYKRSRYEEAARTAEEALSAARSITSVDPALLADAHTAIGKAAGMLRDSPRSLEHNEQAYELALQAFSGDHLHPKVLEMEHDYAASLIDVGRLEDAVPHLERSLASAEKTYGESSLIAAQYAVRLGLAHMERGELAQAIELIERGNRLESTFDLGASPSMAGRLRTLARANFAARRTQEASTHIEAAVEVMQKFDAPFMLRVLEADHAFIHAANGGDIAQAMERLEQVIAAQDQGESRYKTHLPDFYLGTLRLWNNDLSSAMLHLERGVELARAQTRKSDLGEALIQLGYVKLELDDLAAAEQAFKEGLEHLRGTQRIATPAQAEALLGLARVALESAQLDTALQRLNDARASWNDFGPSAAGAGEVRFWLGEVHAARNELQQANESFAAASRALRGSPLPTHVALLRRLRTR